MKFLNRFLHLLLVFFMCATMLPAIAVDANVDETAATTEETNTIPDSTDMTLGMKSSPYVLPENFRGGDPDHSLVHCLEDVYYEKHEHSLIYNPDASALAEGANFESEPNITWETKIKDADGNFKVLEARNTNMAADGGKFFMPGEYQIGNHGARQVGSGNSGAVDVTEGPNPEKEGNDEDKDNALVNEEGTPEETNGAESKTVTAEQNMGVLVHDCTAPDIWIAFQEGGGKVDMAETEEELKKDMIQQIIMNLGRPFSTQPEDFEKASFLFLEEGVEDERDLEPWNKTARLSIAGPLFNERGALKFESLTLPSKINENDYRSHIHVEAAPDKNLKGVFVRRNVPFIFAAISVDNGDGRTKAANASCKIELEDGEEVAKTENAYLFRVPNYPREQYSDQPEYYFIATAKDAEGNLTTIRMPLYVVDTQAAFESGRNQ